MAVTNSAPRQAPREERPPRQSLPAAIGTLVRSFSPLLRAGFAVLALGLVLDVAYHVGVGPGGHEHGEPLAPAALAIHLVVGVGMALTLTGLAATALLHRRKERSKGRR